jgi:DNA-binding transcriptional MerR regulator
MTVTGYFTVIVKTEAHDWSLEELSAEVQRRLAARGLLGAQPDPRVSAAPDARTVRYYTTLGLLDRPVIVGRQARYSPRHALQLLAIKALQAQGQALAAIQERLFGRSESELHHLVDSLAAHAAQRPQIARPLPALKLRELAIEPGVRLVIEEGFRSADLEATLQRIRAALETFSPD